MTLVTGAPVAVFRADAAPGLGGGHVMRCLALAQSLAESGWVSVFAGSPETIETVPAISRLGHAWIEISAGVESEASALRSRMPQGCDAIIVDHYGRDADFESACRGWAAQIFVIEDIPGRAHDCDFLLDPTPGKEPGDYAGLVPRGSRLLLGPNYALLRSQFAAARAPALARRADCPKLSRVFVNLGATDPSNLTSVVLAGIAASGLSLSVDVALGSAAPHVAAVQECAQKLGTNARVHVDVADIAALMAAADLAVGAAGSGSFERCCVGLPSLIVVAADNQRQVAAALVEAGAVVSLGEGSDLRPDRVAAAVRDFVMNESALLKFSKCAAALCDGRGAPRAAIMLASEHAADGIDVTLRPATLADGAIMLEWQQHPTTRRFARNPAVPAEAEHRAWLERKLTDPGTLFSIVLHGADPAGVLRLDRTARDQAAYEVSILIDPEKRGLGLGKAALKLAARLAPEAELFAEVHPDNAASNSLFASAGFRRANGAFRHGPLRSEART